MRRPPAPSPKLLEILHSNDPARLARYMAEIGFSEPSPDGTGLHTKIIGGHAKRVIVVKMDKLSRPRNEVR